MSIKRLILIVSASNVECAIILAIILKMQVIYAEDQKNEKILVLW